MASKSIVDGIAGCQFRLAGLAFGQVAENILALRFGKRSQRKSTQLVLRRAFVQNHHVSSSSCLRGKQFSREFARILEERQSLTCLFQKSSEE